MGSSYACRFTDGIILESPISQASKLTQRGGVTYASNPCSYHDHSN